MGCLFRNLGVRLQYSLKVFNFDHTMMGNCAAHSTRRWQSKVD